MRYQWHWEGFPSATFCVGAIMVPDFFVHKLSVSRWTDRSLDTVNEFLSCYYVLVWFSESEYSESEYLMV